MTDLPLVRPLTLGDAHSRSFDICVAKDAWTRAILQELILSRCIQSDEETTVMIAPITEYCPHGRKHYRITRKVEEVAQ